MYKDRIGLVRSQKRGQVVAVGKHLTTAEVVVNGWWTRRVGWDGNGRSQDCFRIACHGDSIGHCARWISD